MRLFPLATAALAAPLLLAAAPPNTSPLSPERIKEDVRILASDDFEGRGPAQEGEAKAVRYLIRQMAEAGLQPGGERGGWVQAVPLILYNRGRVAMSARVGGTTIPLRAGREITAASTIVGRTRVESATIVFGGYGVSSEALGWDPFRGVDLKGKILLLLWGDPDVEAKRDLGFGGRATVLAGRLGSKIATARALGALGVIVIHEDFSASYPWSQVASAEAAPRYALDEGQSLEGGFGPSGAMRRDVAVDLLRRAGLDFDTLKRQSQSKDFRAVPLRNATLSAEFSTSVSRAVTRNVIGLLPGAARAGETILDGAHYDAYGRNDFDPPSDRIRNGAVDNAVGTATLLEVARAFARGPRPQRSILFAAWAAEEKGLLGASWYAGHPLRPLETTAAVFNLDPHVVLGPTRNLDLVGVGRTPLELDLARAAAARGLRVDPEVNTEAGWYYRSDHLPFAQKGVPTVYFRAGKDLVRGGLRAGEAAAERYNSRCYHQPCDEYDPRWDMTGAAQEGSVAFDMGLELANGGRWPGWNPGSEYAPARETSAAARK